jgi:pyruvate/2-oxoglutarate dehydrogenase complex dihydrolipoamide dehydrogenase (E3) component
MTLNETQTQEADFYDLIILGGGPAGGAAAEAALSLGARVAVIERDHLGGT